MVDWRELDLGLGNKRICPEGARPPAIAYGPPRAQLAPRRVSGAAVQWRVRLVPAAPGRACG